YFLVLFVVHPALLLLAAGLCGLFSLSTGMAAAVALPHPRHRVGRRTRTGEGDYLSTGENSARPQPGVLAVSVIRADSGADSSADEISPILNSTDVFTSHHSAPRLV